MQWLLDNWEVVLLATTLLVNVGNSIVKHYGSDNPGLKRTVLFIIDLVSVLTNSNSPGTLKAPLTASKPPEKS